MTPFRASVPSLVHPDFDTSGQDYEHLGTTKVFTK